MSVLFSAAALSWVSPESQWAAWKRPRSEQRPANGYHDAGLTIGMVSAFPFNSSFSLLPVQRRKDFINTYGCKKIKKKEKKKERKEKLSKAILPGAVLSRCDCETAEMLSNSLQWPERTRHVELRGATASLLQKGHPHRLKLSSSPISSFCFYPAKQMFCQGINCEAADSSGNVYISLRLSSYLMLNPYPLALK